MKRMKRWTGWLAAALAAAVGMVPARGADAGRPPAEYGRAAAAAVAALATETHTAMVNGVTWTYMLSDGNAVLGGGRRTVPAVPVSTSGELAVPAALDGHPVVAVGSYAFHDCTRITGVSLPETVVSVGKDAFLGATALASVSLPEDLVFLGSGAFEECWSLVSISLPESLEEIPEAAFAYCESLPAITMPATVTAIGADAFRGCGMLERATFLGKPPEMADSGLFDLDPPPDLVCRMACYADYRALAQEGQRVLTFDGSGLFPDAASVAFGVVGTNTCDTASLGFANTSTGAVTVTGVSFTGFSSAPVETFRDASAVAGWAFKPSSAWGVQGGVLHSCTNGTAISGYRHASLPDAHADFTVQADVRLAGDQDYSVGLFLRADGDFDLVGGSGYRFQIAPSGSFAVLRTRNGTTSWLTEYWEASAAIRPNAVNTLTVAARGGTFAFLVNGETVWEGNDDDEEALAGPGRVGFFNYDNNIGNYVTIDNLRILEGVFAAGDEESINGSFSVATNFPFTVPSGRAFTLPIAFQPRKTGHISTIVSLETPDGPSETFRASGIGVEDDLSLSGTTALAFAGHTGGPFSPASLEVTVSNSFRLAQSFTVATPAWLDASVSSATLAAGAATNLAFSVNASAAQRATGTYPEEISLLHTDNGSVHALPATLEAYVTGTPVLPDAALVVTNRPGQVQARNVALRNAAGSDGPLAARLTTVETGRVAAASATAASLRAAKALRRASGGVRIDSAAEFSPRRILVRFDHAALSRSATRARSVDPDYAAEAERLCGGKVLKSYPLVPGLVLVELPGEADSADALASLLDAVEADGSVLYAEPDYTVRADLVPNDDGYGNLWGMHNTGQTGGTPGADISAEAAWDITTGSKDVVVAVIDSGVDYTHPDLADNMWTNGGEIPGDGIDNDGNGYVDDIYGIDAANGDCDPKDDHYHGTHCAGTIGAVGNNGTGVAGVCWNVRIMALKFLDSKGRGSDSDAVECIEYAVANGAKVLSNSWGGGGKNQALKDAIEAADEAGVLFVAAAGNERGNNDKNPSYPASYDCANIVAVVSTDCDDLLSVFSNYGAESCDIGAPGTKIYSCEPGGGYQYLSGTSMATPHVAGAAALMLSLNPDLSPAQVKAALMETADPLDALAGKCASGGRMNVAAALKTVSFWADVSPAVVSNIAAGASGTVTVSFDAGSLAIGEYTGLLRATALDKDAATDSMPLRMVVVEDPLSLDATGVLAAVQGEGENASADTLSFSFSNSGGSPVAWTLSASEDWLALSRTSGTLAAGASAGVTVSVSGSEALTAGTYRATVVLENTGTGARFFVTVVLTVNPGTGPLYVDPETGDDANHGRLPAYPMRTLQGAIGRATDGTEILLADGVYGPAVATNGLRLSITGVNGKDKVFIDGGGTNRCCTFFADYDGYNRTYSAVQGTNVTVTGVTLSNGHADGTGTRVRGGAAYGGRYVDCRLLNSAAADSGGGACYAILDRCEVRGNTAGDDGGGLYECQATDTLVAENAVESDGYSYGGGVYYGTLNGCTVAGNGMASGSYPGVYYASATNTVVWTNRVGGNAVSVQAAFSSSKTNAVLVADPGFRAPEDGLWTLSAGSAAIDAGNGEAVENEFDLAGNARVQGDAVDIGCYEGTDAEPVLVGAKRGTGILSAPCAYADGTGNATLTAHESVRRFLRWEDENGSTLGTDRTLTVAMGTSAVRRATAVFESLEFHVDAENGDDANAGTDPAAPLRTLQEAVRRAVSGETIHAAPGVYGPVSTTGKKLEILGAGIGKSIIDGGGTDRCATLGATTNGTVLAGFTLRNGRSTEGGGASYGHLVACELADNYAGEEGGGAYYSLLESCLVARNTAGSDGGGTYYGATYNCSVVGNRTESFDAQGGAYKGSHFNSAFAGNVDANGEETDGDGAGTFSNCLARAENCGMADPFHGDARPRTGSPLIDAGEAAHVRGETDVTGAPRVQGTAVDVGCYEGVRYTGFVAVATVDGHGAVVPEIALFESGDSLSFTAVEDGRRFLRFETNGVFATSNATLSIANATADLAVTAVFEKLVIHADASVASDGDGLSEKTPVQSLQDAIDLACDKDTVRAAPGTYDPIEVRGKRIAVVAAGGPAVTAIDGGGLARCAYLGPSAASGTVLSGFTLRNGYDRYEGGGVYGGTVSNCVLAANAVGTGTSSTYGGAAYDTVLFDCAVFANTNRGYTARGGALYGGKAYRTVFSNNVAIASYNAYGGAAYESMTHDCLFVGNEARGDMPDDGGASYGGRGYGGAVRDGDHRNATMVRNTASDRDGGSGYGGGAYGADLYNSIVFSNTAPTGADTRSCDAVCVYTLDPRFVDAGRGNFRLAPDSPCIDAGENRYVRTETDLAGNDRIANGFVDLGCYERQTEPVAQTLDWTELGTGHVPGDRVPLAAAASGGGKVSFEVLSGPGVVEGRALVFKAAGTVAVRARQAGDEYSLPVEETREVSASATDAAGRRVCVDLAANYPRGWEGGSNGGEGFGAWRIDIRAGGGTGWSGYGIWNPVANAFAGTWEGKTNAFGMIGKGSGFSVLGSRPFKRALAAGEAFSLEMAVNWDSNMDGSKKGFALTAGGNDIVVVNHGSYPGNISVNGSDGHAAVNAYGLHPMTWTFTVVDANTLRFEATARDNPANVSTGTLAVATSAIDGFRLQSDGQFALDPTQWEGDCRQSYYDDFRLFLREGGAATSGGVPYAWLDDYGLGNGTPAGYEAAAGAMAANDVNTVTECYVAGISPVDPNAAFKAALSFGADGNPVVSPDPVPSDGVRRAYTVRGAETMDGAWGPTNAATRFFRLGVKLGE